jgi:hypothetical protein
VDCPNFFVLKSSQFVSSKSGKPSNENKESLQHEVKHEIVQQLKATPVEKIKEVQVDTVTCSMLSFDNFDIATGEINVGALPFTSLRFKDVLLDFCLTNASVFSIEGIPVKSSAGSLVKKSSTISNSSGSSSSFLVQNVAEISSVVKDKAGKARKRIEEFSENIGKDEDNKVKELKVNAPESGKSSQFVSSKSGKP